MNPSDPNIESLELMAHNLQSLLSSFVLVGGAAVGLLITDAARPPVRYTVDVDLLIEVTPLANYYKLCERLRELGFSENPEVICRWKKEGLLIDVMPVDEKVLGFTNRWYSYVASAALQATLPSGAAIRHISAPLFIATKIESFYGRGNGDFHHHDIEDVINVVDGRPALESEIAAAPDEVREFIQNEFDDFLAQSLFTDALSGLFRPEQTEQARVSLVLKRLRNIAGI